jgi:hypothetical protein
VHFSVLLPGVYYGCNSSVVVASYGHKKKDTVEDFPMGVTLNILGGLAVSQLAFMALFFALYHHRNLIGRLLALYAVCLICHVLTYLPGTHANELTQQVFYRMASLAPAVLWLVSRYLFVDNATVSKWVWALMVSYAGLRAYGSLTMGNIPAFNTSYLLYYVIPQFIMLGFSAHAILMADRKSVV